MSRTFRALLLTVLTTLAVAAPASAQLVINEIDYDQARTDTAEFAEIRNDGTTPVDLDPYALPARQRRQRRGLQDDRPPRDEPRRRRLLRGLRRDALRPRHTPDTDLIQNGSPDAVALVNGDAIVDTVLRGRGPRLHRGPSGAPPIPRRRRPELSRVPDGCDTDVNASDFKLVDATPGAANAATSCDATPPGDTAPSVESSDPRRRHRRRARRQPPRHLQRAGDRRRRRVLARLQRHRRRAPVARDDTAYVLDPQQPLPRTTCTLRVEATTTATTTRTTRRTPARTTPQRSDRGGHRPAHPRHPGREPRLALPRRARRRRAGRRHRRAAPTATSSRIRSPTATSGTSEGVFVFTSSAPDASLTPGTAVDDLRPRQRVPLRRRDRTANLTTTEITSATALPAGTGTIAPTLVGRGGRVPPTTVDRGRRRPAPATSSRATRCSTRARTGSTSTRASRAC